MVWKPAHRLVLFLCAAGLLACSGGTGPAGIQIPPPVDPPPVDPGPGDPGPAPNAEPRASLSSETLDLGPDDVAGSVRLVNSGDAALEWTVAGPAWLALQPAGGSLAPGAAVDVTMVPDRTGLAPGTHRGTVVLDSNGGDRTIAVEVVVAAPARLAVSPPALDLGVDRSSSSVAVVNEGDRPLEWSAAANAPGVAVSPVSGTIPGRGGLTLQVSVPRAGLAPGVHRADLRISSNGGEIVVPVTWSVAEPVDAVALSGRIVDQFSRAAVAGVTVRYAGGSAVTGHDGSFSVAGDPPTGSSSLVLEGPGIHRRQTFAVSGPGEWFALPGGFDLRAFDDLAREYEPRTIRWMSPPSLYFDVRPPAGFPAGSESDLWVTEVRDALAGFVAAWTRGRVGVSGVTVGTNPPAEGTPGVIIVRFSEDPGDYSTSQTVGVARTFWAGDRSIYSSRILLRFSLVQGPTMAWARRGVLGHELGHAMGVGHMEVGVPSLMTPSITTGDLTAFDRDAGEVLYSRSPGNRNPDTDDLAYWRGGLFPAAAVPAGAHEWVCGLAASARP